MGSVERVGAGRPFGRHDYEIVLSPNAWPTEAHIGGLASEPLRVGDLYTISRHGDLCDLVVEEIRHESGGRWRARCKLWTGARS